MRENGDTVRSGRGALGGWAATQIRLRNRRWIVGGAERSDIGARPDDLVDPVENPDHPG
jgi:hypothetical protein